MKLNRIPRRTFLKGLGTAIALPALDSLLPSVASAASVAKTFPNRMVFLYVPNGVHMPDWRPTAVGTRFELPYILEPLKNVQDKLTVLTGLTADKARPNGDGPGDHARALAAILTGCQPKKTHGADIRVGVSVDQFAAQRVGKHTKFPSLELGIDRGAQAGNCDSGYSCAYSSNISWSSESTPVAKEIDPRLVFERLFSNGVKKEVEASLEKRDRYKKSILDFVLEDARSLRSQLGVTDQRKLDEYLTGIREIERRLARIETENGQLPEGYKKPTGVPKEYGDHVRLMMDMMVLALQGDLTRIMTFMYANEGSNRSYSFINIPEGHHDLSHHGGDPVKHDKIRNINRFHATHLAYVLEKMNSIPEGEGTLLDHAMVVYCSGISDGNRHNHDDLPVLLAGGGCGTVKPGRHIEYPRNTPINNLWVSLLERMGAVTEKLGDSNGRLENLA
jgi:hypothetical protein